MTRRRIAILGSTGSIGQNTLKVVRHCRPAFEVKALTAYNNIALLEKDIREFRPEIVAVAKAHLPALRSRWKTVRFMDVDEDLDALVGRRDVDIVVLAMTGSAALGPFLAAVRAGKTVAPANKEALVMAGEIIMEEARRCGSRIIPVDSEQSAIFQCLEGQRREDLKRVILTASGGPLKDIPVKKHHTISVEDVLKHPRWCMGAKITVDSATLMNKGFEVIEAQRLFGLSVHEVDVVVHPQAIIHSMVEFCDGSVLAQMGVADMCVPIQYALTYPRRHKGARESLDLTTARICTFEKPDMVKFPSLKLAYMVAGKGGTLPAVLNAADEVAVEAFLKGQIKFTTMFKIVEKTVLAHRNGSAKNIKEILAADGWARIKAREALRKAA
ncbi:MAG: 1-deoxy-D-xylulose-5-phosphate reductoisomerase [Candidatus Omnitrophica bacterium]|nr:1-deoxy-D-xylulose-5-phosphate reductoisomerase [Candidatus Omnitrophota bacterium]